MTIYLYYIPTNAFARARVRKAGSKKQTRKVYCFKSSLHLLNSAPRSFGYSFFCQSGPQTASASPLVQTNKKEVLVVINNFAHQEMLINLPFRICLQPFRPIVIPEIINEQSIYIYIYTYDVYTYEQMNVQSHALFRTRKWHADSIGTD